jgi:hypothetical protein
MAVELIMRAFLIALCVVFLQGALSQLLDVQVPALVWIIVAAGIFVPMTVGLYSRSAEAEFGRSPPLNRQQWLRRLATALWSTPLALFPVWLLLLFDPSPILEHWDVLLLLYGLPFAAAAALYFFASRVGSPPPQDHSA